METKETNISSVKHILTDEEKEIALAYRRKIVIDRFIGHIKANGGQGTFFYRGKK